MRQKEIKSLNLFFPESYVIALVQATGFCIQVLRLLTVRGDNWPGMMQESIKCLEKAIGKLVG